MANAAPQLTGDIVLDSRNRLLVEILGVVQKATGGWSVLVLDDETTKITSSLAGLSDILDYGVSLVENINKRREPFPLLAGVYFLTPCLGSVNRLIEDFALGSQPQYKEAHVFFSSSCPPELLSTIKNAPPLVKHLTTLKEMHLEYIAVDTRVICTDQPDSLVEAFGDHVGSAAYKQVIKTAARRLATVFAVTKEMPSIRYRANHPSTDMADLVPDSELRRIVPQTIAKELYTILMDMQKKGTVPPTDSCDLIILDRGYDCVAPLIHEWTYEAMMHDVLPPGRLKGKVYVRDKEIAGMEVKKEHILDSSDNLWTDVRHQHVANAFKRIRGSVEEAKQREQKAYGKTGNAGSVKQLDSAQLRKLMQRWPQYQQQANQASVHTEIATQINEYMNRNDLTTAGRLEQDVVFGECTAREVTTFFQEFARLPSNVKTRVLACYLATHPEKLDADSAAQWKQLGRLTDTEMRSISNLEYLLCPVYRRAKGMARLKAGIAQMTGNRKRAVRKDRDGDSSELALCRFEPVVADLLDDLVVGKLSNEDYPNIAGHGPSRSAQQSPAPSVLAAPANRQGGASVLAKRATPAWAQQATQRNMQTGAGETRKVLPRERARKVFVFILGGATWSEVRVAHSRSTKLNRDVILVSTSMEAPGSFMDKLAKIGNHRFV